MMKGKLDATENKRRRWSNHGRVCDHNSGSRRVCRITSWNIAFGRGENDAFRTGSWSNRKPANDLISESGTITAEFALVIPSVVLIIVFGISIMGLQNTRIQLVDLAAVASRALARGEDLDDIKVMVQEVFQAAELQTEVRNDFSCVNLTVVSKVFWIGEYKLNEQQCSRKSGL